MLEDYTINGRLSYVTHHLVVAGDDDMQYLSVETFGAHIWECVEWRAPFAQWLMDAAHVETRRQQFLHTDWMDAAAVTALAESTSPRIIPPRTTATSSCVPGSTTAATPKMSSTSSLSSGSMESISSSRRSIEK